MSLMPLEEARTRLLGALKPTGRVERVALKDALGRVLAEDLGALRTQPAFPASAMDGWAVRAADCTEPGARLSPIGESAAGHAFAGTVKPGETVRIFTGAPLPKGADSVLIQEDAEADGPDAIRTMEAVSKGQHIRPAGIDFREGDRLLGAGDRLTPGALSLAASANHPVLSVRARPRVAILSTGDELVWPGETVGPAQIVASNVYGVAAIAEKAGASVVRSDLLPDDAARIGESLERALAEEIDVFVTVGGASVGDHDLIAPVLKAKGVTLDFWKIAMRPGKPLMAGRSGATTILGLPGNPASALVTATLFLKPMIETLLGLTPDLAYRPGILGDDVEANGERVSFLRARRTIGPDGEVRITPLPRQDSSLLSIYAGADVLLMRDRHAPEAREGSPCRYVELDR